MATAALPPRMLDLAEHIDARRAKIARRFVGKVAEEGSWHHAAAVLLSSAYPALAQRVEAQPERIPPPGPVDLEALAARAEAAVALDEAEFRRELRRLAEEARWQIALREVLPPELGGAPLEETAQELSRLADITIEAALAEAKRQVVAKWGEPKNEHGEAGSLVVIGMGKLGGLELNCGSDVDLICFYDSDDAALEAQKPQWQQDEAEPLDAHQLWTKVVQRMTESLADVTEDGFVWRVDHRLRPEGARGPLVNSVAAAERYYESFGRLWERAALLRARPVAGDLALGDQVLRMLEPFVWTRRVDPSIAERMFALVRRARAESAGERTRDLKLGPGGIREAEFFVQALQLIWGGREPQLRVRPTIEATERLLTLGLVTHREAEELVEAYVALRRAEHATQWSTGVQTHRLPRDPADRERLARSLGLDDRDALAARLEGHCRRVSGLLSSLLPEDGAPPSPWGDALLALDRDDEEAFVEALAAAGMPDVGDSYDGQLERDLFETAKLHPDGLLGSRTRESRRAVVDTLLDAIADAADPTMAARYLRGFASGVWPPSVYTKLLADDPARMRRIVSVLGGSAFVGEAVARRPELADLVLFTGGIPSPDDARAEVEEATGRPPPEDADLLDHRVAQLRKAQRRVTTQVALADIAGDLDTPQATRVLSSLADATLASATRFALGCAPGEPCRGLAILAMGKLGGSEIGYGSDLDVIFLYDPQPGQEDPGAIYTKAARKIIQLITMPHVEGRGYELDTRLRPSGNQGLLVVSLQSFAGYHGVATERAQASGQRAATWERLALLRARFAAGDEALGLEAERIAREAAFRESGPEAKRHDEDQARHVHHLRQRMEEELARERPGRYDLKLGRGGLVDVEFAVQMLQLSHGQHESVRTTETAAAIEALREAGALDEEQAAALGEGYAFLRRLEQRMRVLHGDSAHLLEERAAGLHSLARRMGIRGPAPAAELLTQYRAITERVRATYEAIVVDRAARD